MWLPYFAFCPTNIFLTQIEMIAICKMCNFSPLIIRRNRLLQPFLMQRWCALCTDFPGGPEQKTQFRMNGHVIWSSLLPSDYHLCCKQKFKHIHREVVHLDRGLWDAFGQSWLEWSNWKVALEIIWCEHWMLKSNMWWCDIESHSYLHSIQERDLIMNLLDAW